MRYRELSPEGDYVFTGNPNFLIDSPEAVGQAIESRLNLYVREWFLDLNEGLDLGDILGYHTATTRDIEIKQRILGTRGVTSLTFYESTILPGRKFQVRADVATAYGPISITKDYQP